VFSSARRGQVEPLPALVAVAAFALALSLYGTTLQGIAVETPQDVPDATEKRVRNTLMEGVVVYPDRLADLDRAVPAGTAVAIRAEGRIWRYGPAPGPDQHTVRRHVLVWTENGTVPGVLEVTGR